MLCSGGLRREGCVSIELYCNDVPGTLKDTEGKLGWMSKLNVGCEFCSQEYK